MQFQIAETETRNFPCPRRGTRFKRALRSVEPAHQVSRCLANICFALSSGQRNLYLNIVLLALGLVLDSNRA